jgi:hypothetical protein
MVDVVEAVIPPERPAGPLRFALRAAWVAARWTLVFYLGQQGALFFYQGF